MDLDGVDVLSQREATGALTRKFGLSRTTGQRVLASGLAGEPLRSTRGLFYDGARVADLLVRRGLRIEEHLQAFPRGVFIGRRAVAASRPVAEQLPELATGWGPMSMWTSAFLRIECTVGSLPFVATVGGFVVLGADLISATVRKEDGLVLELREPGAWFEGVQHRRLPSRRGGRSWQICPPSDRYF